MRISLTIALAYVLSLPTFAQDNVDLNQMVGFACYYEGRATKTVEKVTRLLKRKRYEDISRLLTSGNSGEKYLAVISLRRLAQNGQYVLSAGEKELIEKAKMSDDLVSVCSGCTYFDKVPMKKLLNEDNFIGSSYWLDGVMNKILNDTKNNKQAPSK